MSNEMVALGFFQRRIYNHAEIRESWSHSVAIAGRRPLRPPEALSMLSSNGESSCLQKFRGMFDRDMGGRKRDLWLVRDR